MHYDALVFKGLLGFVNCTVSSDAIVCGAAFFAAHLPEMLPVFSLDGQQVALVAIPERYRAEPSPSTVFSINDDLRFPLWQQS